MFSRRWVWVKTWRILRSASVSVALIPKKKWIMFTEKVINNVTRLREMSPLYEMAKEGIDLKKVSWQRE